MEKHLLKRHVMDPYETEFCLSANILLSNLSHHSMCQNHLANTHYHGTAVSITHSPF